MTDFSRLFLYLPGIVIFFVGSGRVRQWLRMHKADFCIDASVVSCSHVVKRDKKEREIYNYYNVVVEYVNPQTKHTERQAVKSPTEYALGQQVRIDMDRGGNKRILAESLEEPVFHPLTTMIGGALLIVLALEQNQGKELQAMLCLVCILIGAGANLIVHYISLKRRGLQTIDAEIIDVYERQISKETKILKGAKYTYYPVVRYVLDGSENIRRCLVNSSGQKTFQKGEHIELYYDPGTRTVTEKRARIGLAVAGAVLVIIGIAGASGILSVIM